MVIRPTERARFDLRRTTWPTLTQRSTEFIATIADNDNATSYTRNIRQATMLKRWSRSGSRWLNDTSTTPAASHPSNPIMAATEHDIVVAGHRQSGRRFVCPPI